jgi:hypothetical protein
MAIIASLTRAPETPQSASAAAPRPREIEEDDAQFLEVRTENGTVYLLPSRWQRIRLQWTFRHFRVLPTQLLSRGDRRLIEKLSQSAVVTPPLPVRSNVVFGVVEKPRSKPLAFVNRAVASRTALAATQGLLAKPEVPELPSLVLSELAKQREAKRAAGGIKTADPGYVPFRQWRDLGTLAAAGVIVIAASVYLVPRFSAVQTSDRRTLSTSSKHSANEIKPPIVHSAATSPIPAPPATPSLASAEKPKRPVAPPQPGPVLAGREAALVASQARQSLSASISRRSPLPALGTVSPIPGLALVAPAAVPGRRFVADLPPRYFARPFVSDGKLVGELRLKGFTDADGAVKAESILSAGPRLGEAAMPDFRQWHYSPYQVLGEMQSKMSFLGPDAAPTASAANRPSSLAK